MAIRHFILPSMPGTWFYGESDGKRPAILGNNKEPIPILSNLKCLGAREGADRSLLAIDVPIRGERRKGNRLTLMGTSDISQEEPEEKRGMRGRTCRLQDPTTWISCERRLLHDKVRKCAGTSRRR
jgi:hypothetical protein